MSFKWPIAPYPLSFAPLVSLDVYVVQMSTELVDGQSHGFHKARVRGEAETGERPDNLTQLLGARRRGGRPDKPGERPDTLT